MTEIENALELIDKRQNIQGSLYDHVKFIFSDIYKKTFLENFHHKILAHELQKIASGEYPDHSIFIFNIGPRYTKTEFAVNGFVSWAYLNNPQCNFIHCSTSDLLVKRNSDTIKSIIASKPYQQLREITLKQSRKSKTEWATTDDGNFLAISVGGGVIGSGAGVLGASKFSGAIIIDDPNKPQEIESEAHRRYVNKDFFDNTILSRRNGGDKTPIIIIQQRLHEDDLSGHVLNSKHKVKHIVFQGLKTDSYNHQMDRRKIGQALWPVKHSREDFLKMKRESPILYANQYAQTPAPAEGNMIKRAWLKEYANLPDKLDFLFISCDLNFKKEGRSRVALSVYGVQKELIFLIDQRSGHWNFPESQSFLLELMKKYNDYNAVLIEDKANGPAMIATLNDLGCRSIIPINVDTSKTLRLAQVSPIYQAGQVYYPKSNNCPWIIEHITELITFPNFKYDDKVDAETQMLQYYVENMKYVKFYDV